MDFLGDELKSYLESILAADGAAVAARRTLAELEFAFGSAQARGGILDLADAIVAAEGTLLVGAAGSGKTTLLRAIAHDYAGYALNRDGDLSPFTLCEEWRVPVYIDLAADETAVGPPTGRDDGPAPPLLVLIDNVQSAIAPTAVGPPKADVEIAIRIEALASRFAGQRLVVALRPEDAPFVRPWLPPCATVRLEPLSEASASRYAAARWGEAMARASDDIVNRHHLEALGRSPRLSDNVAALCQEVAALPSASARLLAALGRTMLGPVGADLWPPLAEMAFLAKRRGEGLEAETCLNLIRRSVLAATASGALADLVGLGILAWTEGRHRLVMGNELWQDLFAAFHLDMLRRSGRALAEVLPADLADWRRCLVFAYELISPQARRSLLSDLVALDPALAADCAATEPSGGAFQALQATGLSPELQLTLGRRFAAMGRWEDARAHLEAARRAYPQRPDILVELAAAHNTGGRSLAALECLQQAVVLSAETTWQLNVADALVGLDRADEAKAHLTALAAVYEQARLEALSRLAELAAAHGEPDEAVAILRDVVAVSPSARYLHQLGVLLHRLGRRAEAREPLEQAALADRSAEPQRRSLAWPLAHADLAALLAEEGFLGQAVAHARQAAALDPAEPRYQLTLGHCLRLAGQLEAAARALRAALRLSPDCSAAHAELAQTLEAQGRPAEALAAAQAALAIEPAPLHHRLVGWLLRDLGRLPEAANALHTALAAAPENADWRDRLGVVLLEQSQLRAAAAQFQEAIRLAPTNARYHRNWGVALAEAGDVEAALRAFDEALACCAPDGDSTLASLQGRTLAADVHWQRGRLLEAAGDKEAAAAAYHQASALAPSNLDYRIYEAAAYSHLGDPAQTMALSLEGLERAIAADPTDAYVIFRLGQTYEAIGQTQAALRHYRRAADIELDAADIAKALGRLLHAAGDANAAVASLAHAAALAPTDAEAHYLLGLAIEDTADRSAEPQRRSLTNAMTALRAAVRLSPDNADYWVALGRVERRLGRLPEARHAVSIALASLSEGPAIAEAHAEMGRILADQGQLEAALAAARRALAVRLWRTAPKPEHVFLAGSLCQQLGQTDEATRLLADAVAGAAMAPPAWYLALGRALVATNRQEEAVTAFRRAAFDAASTDAEAADAALAASELLWQHDQREAAVELLETAVRRAPDPPFTEGRRRLIAFRLELGQAEMALPQAQLLAQTPDAAAQDLALMGQVLAALQRWQGASRLLERAVAADPTDWRWHHALATAYHRLGHFDSAESEYQRALETAPAESAAVVWADLGSFHRQQGRPDGAVVAFEAALADPSSLADTATAWAELGDCYLALGRGPEAAAAYQHGFAAGAVETPELRRNLGRALLQQSNAAAAIAELERALTLRPDDAETHRLLARAWRTAGDGEAALHYARRAQTLAPDDAASLRELGLTLLDQPLSEGLNGLGPAAEYLQAALARNPDDAAAWDGLAQFRQTVGDLDGAAVALSKACQIAPTEPQYVARWAAIEHQCGRLADVLDALDAACREPTATAAVHAWHGAALETTDRVAEAADAYERAASLAPDVAAYHYDAGRIAAVRGRTADAIAHLEAALHSLGEGRQAPDETAWRLALADLYRRQGDYATAVDHYLAAADADADAWHELGRCLSHLGRHAEARTWLEKALIARPSFPERATWLADLGEARLAAGDAAGALTAFTEAERLEPTSAAHPIGRARAERALGQLATAAQTLEALLAGEPPDDVAAAVHAELGLVAMERKQPRTATGHFARAIALGPQSIPIHLTYIDALNATDRRDDAVAHLQSLADPNDAPAEQLSALGHAFEALASWESALGCYRRAWRADPSREGLAHLRDTNRMLVHLSRAAEARQLIEAALSHDEGEPSLLAELGALLEAGDDTSGAAAAYRRAVAVAPKVAEYQFHLGRLLAELGRFDEAQAALEAAVALEPDNRQIRNRLAAVSAELTLRRARRAMSRRGEAS